MNSRCDNIEVKFFVVILYLELFHEPHEKDCDDSSDEKNCRTVSFDEEKYLKNKPPPPPIGLEKLPVIARFEYIMRHVKTFFLQCEYHGDPRDKRNPTNSSAEV